MTTCVVILITALFQCGCHTSHEAAPAASCSKPSSLASASEILSPLLKKYLGTAGTFNTDHTSAKKYLESVDSELLTPFMICPFRHFLTGHDIAYDGSRSAWLKQSSVPSHPYPPIGLSKYMLFCRFLSNAAQINASRECQSLLLRDADNAMQSLGRPGSPNLNSNEYDQFNVVRHLCLLMGLSKDCPSYALEASLAMDGARIPTKSSQHGIHIIQLILDTFVDIRIWWSRCPQNQHSYREYVTRIISKAREIILPRTRCSEKFLEETLIRLNEIDTEYRTSLPCSTPVDPRDPNLLQAH